AWHGALRSQTSDRDLVRSLVQRRDLYGSAPLAGIVLRLPAPARPRSDPLSGCLLAASLGQRHAVQLARGLSWTRIRSVQGRDPAAQSAPAGVPRRSHVA